MYITINATASYIDIEYNLLTEAAKFKRSRWRKDHLSSLYQTNTGLVSVRTLTGMLDYMFSVNGVDSTLPVSSVNGVTPTSNDHLYELLATCAE